MFQKTKPTTTPTPRPIDGSAADRHRERMAKRSRTTFAAVADVGQIAPVKDPARRERCRLDLHAFLQTYFPGSTGIAPFSEDHKRAIDRLQRCALVGGLFSNSFPRGFAKTTISENFALWCILYGHRRFVAIFGSSGTAASGMIDSIKSELAENELLAEDFPEICQAIHKLEGKPQRCASQHHAGVLTHIEWTEGKIVLPSIAHSAGGGAVVVTKGMDAATRGLKHKTPGGKQQRPDLAIVDDPQTDESARSEVQTAKRIDIIRKNILKLGGHNRKIAAVMNATVIQKGDLVEQMADRAKFPAWQHERIQMVKAWAKVNDTLWLQDYATLRNTFDPLMPGDRERAIADANAFYLERQAEMDDGCVVTWPEGPREADEISAIQHAYNMLIDDGPDVFASECQNEPLVDEGQKDGVTAEQILTVDRFNRLPMGRVPITCSRLVGHIDVHANVLYWTVMAFDEQFGGTVVDFGTWPKIDRAVFTMSDIKKSLRDITKADSDQAAIIAAVKMCAAELFARPWQQGDRLDGPSVALERVGVDANWGPFKDEVYQACRESDHRGKLIPTHGMAWSPTSFRRMEDTKLDPADRGGIGWRYIRNPAKLKNGVPYLNIDVNRWKTFAEKRLQTTPNSAGSIMLNGRPTADGKITDRYRLLAQHWTAETCTMVEAMGRTVPVWTKLPNRENHLLDNLVACLVLANLVGVREPTATMVKKKAPLSMKAAIAAAAERKGGSARPAQGYAKFRRGPGY